MHDSITLWSLPLVAGITFERTRSTSLTLVISGGFLFSGLMFGPDLDVYSRQYKRWGWLRWLWLPYRRSMRHRAFLSHGPIIGTVVRIVYLTSWLGALVGLVALVSAIAHWLTGETEQWLRLVDQYWHGGTAIMGRSLRQYPAEWVALLIGLELGALSHSLSDWLGSWYKRRFGRLGKFEKSKSPVSPVKEPLLPNLSHSPGFPSHPPFHPPTSTSPHPSLPTVELPVLPPAIQPDSKLPPFR
jgi:uncharacterized metal-binding protein